MCYSRCRSIHVTLAISLSWLVRIIDKIRSSPPALFEARFSGCGLKTLNEGSIS